MLPGAHLKRSVSPLEGPFIMLPCTHLGWVGVGGVYSIALHLRRPV